MKTKETTKVVLLGTQSSVLFFQEMQVNWESLQRFKTSTGRCLRHHPVHHLVFVHLVEACALIRRSQAATDGVQRNGTECQQKGKRTPARSRKCQQTEKSPENT